MSHKWAANAYGHLSERAMQAARTAIQKSPWLISHDNVNVPLRVFSQRLNNQSHFVVDVDVMHDLSLHFTDELHQTL
jgi:hypothetical protein